MTRVRPRRGRASRRPRPAREPDDPATVVDVDDLCGRGIDLRQTLVRGGRIGVVGSLERGSVFRVDRCGDGEVRDRGAEVEPCPTGNDDVPVGGDQLVDLGVRERRVLADRHLLGELAEGGQASRLRRLVGQDRHPCVHLERVRRDDLRAESCSEGVCDRRLPGCRRTEDGDDGIVQSGHVRWGTPAHHPLRAYRRNPYACVTDRVECVHSRRVRRRRATPRAREASSSSPRRWQPRPSRRAVLIRRSSPWCYVSCARGEAQHRSYSGLRPGPARRGRRARRCVLRAIR